LPPGVAVVCRQISRWVVGLGGKIGGRSTGEQSLPRPGILWGSGHWRVVIRSAPPHASTGGHTAPRHDKDVD
jgi:hypothetical protein